MTTTPTPTPIPPDAYWTRLSGGGTQWLYLVRPREANDPKVYEAKEI